MAKAMVNHVIKEYDVLRNFVIGTFDNHKGHWPPKKWKDPQLEGLSIFLCTIIRYSDNMRKAHAWVETGSIMLNRRQ